LRPPHSTPLASLCLLCVTLAAHPAAAQQDAGSSEGPGGPTIDVPILGEIPVPGFLAGLLDMGRDGPEGAAQAQGENRPPAVVFQRAETRPVGDSFRFLGRVTPIERVEVQARVSGFIEEVAFEGGAFVERGDLLFQIQREQYEIAVAAARARLDSAEAANAETQRQLERQRELRESNTISQANLDDAISAAEAAQAEVRQAETELRQAELELGYTSIEAAIDGKMSAPLITRGNYVSGASGILAELVQLDPIWGVFSLGENRLSRWRRLGIGTGEIAPIEEDGSSGQAGSGTGRSDAEAAEDYRLRLVLPDGSIYAEEGEFAFVGNTVDAQTGTVEVRVRFANPDSLLLPNQNVTLRVEEADPPVLPVIQQAAIQLGREGRAVWVVTEDDTVARIPVEVEPGLKPGTVAVTRGLEGGERVIVRGALRLEEGQTVDPRTAGGQGGLPGADGPGGSGQGSGGSGGSQ
jgi:RND family efflux transporter MFP subunit